MDSSDRLIELLLLQQFMEKEDHLKHYVFSLPESMRDPDKVENLKTIQALKLAQIERLKELKIL